MAQPTIYPWNKWFPVNKINISLALKKGDDFQSECYSFAQQIRNWIKKHRPNLKVSIQIEKNKLHVSTYKG